MVTSTFMNAPVHRICALASSSLWLSDCPGIGSSQDQSCSFHRYLQKLLQLGSRERSVPSCQSDGCYQSPSSCGFLRNDCPEHFLKRVLQLLFKSLSYLAPFEIAGSHGVVVPISLIHSSTAARAQVVRRSHNLDSDV